jgi:hypothetical protein
MFNTLTERSERYGNDVHRWANLSLRLAGVLVAAAVVFVALYAFVEALE